MAKIFAPTLKRSWLEAEIIPSNKKIVTTRNVKSFQIKLATQCGMHIFCGPMIIAPDSTNKLISYYSNKKFKPRDWNAYMWWTQPNAKNILSILDHSHTSFYYYPEHNLIDVSIATCKEYDLDKTLGFIYSFWKPNISGIKYAYVSPERSKYSWKTYKL
ncbi:MAG: hypothetical protein WC741_04010 [Patescibacteria group bacterium]|jgi:S-adenosylmethionine/arginine decarboxylase-like enzyme